MERACEASFKHHFGIVGLEFHALTGGNQLMLTLGCRDTMKLQQVIRRLEGCICIQSTRISARDMTCGGTYRLRLECRLKSKSGWCGIPEWSLQGRAEVEQQPPSTRGEVANRGRYKC